MDAARLACSWRRQESPRSIPVSAICVTARSKPHSFPAFTRVMLEKLDQDLAVELKVYVESESPSRYRSSSSYSAHENLYHNTDLLFLQNFLSIGLRVDDACPNDILVHASLCPRSVSETYLRSYNHYMVFPPSQLPGWYRLDPLHTSAASSGPSHIVAGVPFAYDRTEKSMHGRSTC